MGEYIYSGATYYYVSKGKLINRRSEKALDGWEGKIVALTREEDEFEGKKAWKYHLWMADGPEKVAITFREESYFALGFFSRITQAKVNEPLLVGVMGSTKNEKISFCYLKQYGETIPKDEAFPQPEKVSVGKAEVVVWDKPVEKMKEIAHSVDQQVKSNEIKSTPAASDEEGLPF